MEKIIKHYIEKCYYGEPNNEIVIEEVEEKDPFKVKNDRSMLGFRFYDRECIIDHNKIYYADKENYSNYIYFGERLSRDEFEEVYGLSGAYVDMIYDMKNNGIEDVCFTQDGSSFVPMQSGDMTYEEFLEKIPTQEFKAREMFDKLRENIGKEVKCYYLWAGFEYELGGKLEEVKDFRSVRIDKTIVPFIDYREAISAVLTEDKILYKNPIVLPGLTCSSFDDVYTARKITFGERIADEEHNELSKSNKEKVLIK